MSTSEVMPILLLLLVSTALSIGISMFVFVLRRNHESLHTAPSERVTFCPLERTCVFRRPDCWLAIRGTSLSSVQSALGLNNPKPCSWIQGLAGEEKLFIAPPVKGWILVFGSGLPEPTDDVDACFRFVVGLSRKVGQVQLFSLSRVLHHHAWIKADTGKVQRAYAWAGETLWQQGRPTQAERDLDLRCFNYAEAVESSAFGGSDALCANVDKVPLLAARWSLDPAHIEEKFFEAEPGIAGEPSRRY